MQVAIHLSALAGFWFLRPKIIAELETLSEAQQEQWSKGIDALLFLNIASIIASFTL